jgi:hypothetical protein
LSQRNLFEKNRNHHRFSFLLFGCSAKEATKSYTEEEINALIDAKIATLSNVDVIDGTKLEVYPSESFSWLQAGTSLKIYVESIVATITNVDFESLSQGEGRYYDGYLPDDIGYAPYDVHLVITGNLGSKYSDYYVNMVFSNEERVYTNVSIDVQADGTFISDLHLLSII